MAVINVSVLPICDVFTLCYSSWLGKTKHAVSGLATYRYRGILQACPNISPTGISAGYYPCALAPRGATHGKRLSPMPPWHPCGLDCRLLLSKPPHGHGLSGLDHLCPCTRGKPLSTATTSAPPQFVPLHHIVAKNFAQGTLSYAV
jgi:hypothetical protein